MKTLRFSLFSLLMVLLYACGDDAPSTMEGGTPAAETLEQIMDGERAWHVVAVDSDLPYDFDSVTTTDWYSQMPACYNDDPFYITYDTRNDALGPDDLNIEVHAGRGVKCSEFEMEDELIVYGSSIEKLHRYELSPVTVIHDQLYGYTSNDDTMDEEWREMTFAENLITYVTTKVRDGQDYEVTVQLAPL